MTDKLWGAKKQRELVLRLKTVTAAIEAAKLREDKAEEARRKASMDRYRLRNERDEIVALLVAGPKPKPKASQKHRGDILSQEEIDQLLSAAEGED